MNTHPLATARRSRRLASERLEDRDLLDGNVAATVAVGTLILRGDNLNNDLNIYGTGTPGQVVVEGLHATKVGSPPVSTRTFNGVQSLSIDLRGGDDRVTISHLQLVSNLTIVAGPGNDLVALGSGAAPAFAAPAILPESAPTASVTVGGVTAIDTGAGNDMLVFSSVSGAGAVSVVMGSGNDGLNSTFGNTFVVPAGATANGMLGPVTLLTTKGASFVADMGSGDDAINLEAIDISGSVVLMSAAGIDSIYVDQADVGGNFTATTGLGNDHVGLMYLNVAKDVRVDTGAGTDETVALNVIAARDVRVVGSNTGLMGVSLDEVEARDATITQGGSQDEVYVYRTNVRDLTITTDGGNDLVVLGARIEAKLAQVEQVDGVGVHVSRRAMIDTGIGDDQLSIVDSYFAYLSVSLGAGKDTGSTANSQADWLFGDGGLGYDRGIDAGGNTYGVKTYINFEELLSIV